jgi:predicted Rdx family selenoprotein
MRTPDYYTFPESSDAMTLIEGLNGNFNIGCAIKYIVRHGRKTGAPAVEDLEKAIDCLEREIKRRAS